MQTATLAPAGGASHLILLDFCLLPFASLMFVFQTPCSGQVRVKSSQVANPRNAFCIEQRTAAKSKEAQVRVFGLFLLLPRLAPVGLIAR